MVTRVADRGQRFKEVVDRRVRLLAPRGGHFINIRQITARGKNSSASLHFFHIPFDHKYKRERERESFLHFETFYPPSPLKDEELFAEDELLQEDVELFLLLPR